MNIEEEVNKIIERNKKVELDKAWETSVSRKIIVLFLTYFVIVLFMIFANVGRPYIDAIVPTIGFFLSTLTIPFAKKWWIKKHTK